MSARITAIGIDPRTQTAVSYGEFSAGDVLQMLQAGEIIVPATPEQCRTLAGKHISYAYAVALGMTTPDADPGPITRIGRLLGMPEDSNPNAVTAAVCRLHEKLTNPKPLNVVLHCPACKLQHIDAPEYPDWRNPPHRTHKCAGCGAQWTAADTNTNGVRAIKPGSSATWPAPDLTRFAADRLPARDQYGHVWHPDLPEMGEDEIVNPYLWAIGFDCKFVNMEGDAPALYDTYSDAGEPDCSAWIPSTPEGGGWLLAAIYDTEDGPYALYVRPFPAPAPVATAEAAA